MPEPEIRPKHQTLCSRNSTAPPHVDLLAGDVHLPAVVGDHRFRPTANRLFDERTYITPSDSAGVAMSISPIEFVAT